MGTEVKINMNTEIKKQLPDGANKVPDHVIEALARSMLPMLRDFYDSEEGQKAFAEWKAQQPKRPEKKHKKDTLSR